MYDEGSVAQDLITSGLLMDMTNSRSGESESMDLLMPGHVVFLAYLSMSPITILAISTFITLKWFASVVGSPSICTLIEGQKLEI